MKCQTDNKAIGCYVKIIWKEIAVSGNWWREREREKKDNKILN